MKRILSLFICVMLILSSVSMVGFASASHWSYDYIKGMISDGIITGDQNGNLNLDNTITRAEFAKTVNKYFGYTTKATEGFKDVTADKWYYNDLLIAKGTGYMMGDTAGFANPDGKITRAEAFVIIARILNLNDDNTVSFTDSETIPLWAKGKIGALVKAGIVSGYTDGSINAKGNLTRAEAFVVISKNERPSMPDNSGSEAPGNTSSMVNNGGTTSSGGGGGGGGAPSGGTATASATVAIKNIDVNTFDIALQAKNASSFTIKLESGSYSVEEKLETVSQNGVFTGNIKPLIEKAIAVNAANYGKKAKISVKANGTVGVLSSGWVYYSKEIIIDKGIPAVENILLTIGDNEKYTLTFDKVSGATEYKATVYADEGLTEEKASFKASTNEITVDLSDSSKFIEGKTYYITVSAKIGEYYGVKYSSVSPVIIGMGGGDGSVSSPYLIYTKDQLMNISKAPDKAYKLMADITASTPIKEPVTKENVKFTGKLDGNGYSIYMDINYSVTVGAAVGTGLFCNVDGASFENLTLEGKINGRSQLGGLVGYAVGATNFKNITNRANITSTGSGTSYFVGGVVGYHAGSGEIIGCKNYGDISSTNCQIGGIIGRNAANVAISRCGNIGNLSNTGLVGGIISQGYGSLTMCYNMGDVKGQYPAGIVARPYANPFKVSYSFNAGKIEKTSTVEPAAIAVSYETSASYKADISYCYNLTEGISLTSRYANNTASNCYTLSTTETMAGVTKLTKQELTALDLGERFTLYEDNLTNDDYNKNYYYPQLTKNLIPMDVTYEDEDMGMSVVSVSYDAGILSFVIEKFPQVGVTKKVKVQLVPLTEAYDEPTEAVVNIPDMSVLSYNVSVGIPESGCKAVKITALSESGNYLGEAVMPISIGIFSGSGTEADPYIIDSGERFEAIFGINGVDTAKSHNQEDVYFIQTNDIIIPEGFEPNYTDTFKGNYICGSISNGVITKASKKIEVNINSSKDKTALFPNATGAYISGIIVNGSITGGKNTAAIAGTTSSIANMGQSGTIIENCINNARISGTSHSSGIIGTSAGTTLRNCINNGDISTSAQYVGGISGWANTGTYIVDCINNGKISAGSTYAGGITGVTYNAKIEKTANTGAVSGNGAVGGIAGQLTTPNASYVNVQYNGLYECWNSGDVISNGTAGGLTADINMNYSSSKLNIENCFNTGSVSSETGSAGNLIYKAAATKSGVTISGHQLIIKGCYAPYAISDPICLIDSTIENELTVSGVYTLGDTAAVYPSGAKELTKEEIIALPGSDADFSSDIWEVKAGYVLPQLKNNLYEGPDYIQPIDITYSYNPTEETYTINWMSSADAENYDVYVNGEKITSSPITKTTYDITSSIKNNSEIVYVTINKDGKSYPSNKIGIYYGDGEGTVANPWKIYNVNQLNNVRLNLDAHFIQVNDIYEEITEPIGTGLNPFTGSYKGADNEIKRVTLNIIACADDSGVGMFGAIKGAHILNIATYGTVVAGSKADTISGKTLNCAGGIAGYSIASTSNGSIENCVNYADISRSASSDAGYCAVGGIVGYNPSLPVIKCVNYGSATDSYEANCAGIVGYSATKISGCKNYGAVICSQSSVGGISGAAYAVIENCANFGEITSISKATQPAVGGIAGTMAASCDVYNSYNAGNITGTNRVGGIAGRVMETDKKTTESIIENCFNTGVVTSTKIDVASILAYFYRGGKVTIKNCFDTANENMLIVANTTSITVDASAPVISNSYVLGASSGAAITNGGKTISASDLKNLMTIDSTYSSGVWCKKDNFDYPQLISIPYEKFEKLEIESYDYDASQEKYVLKLGSVAAIEEKIIKVTYEAKSGEGDNTVLTFNANSEGTYLIDPMTDLPTTGIDNMIVEIYDVNDTLVATLKKTIDTSYLVGDGSKESPYWVMSLDNLMFVTEKPSAYYIQKADIVEVTSPVNGFTGNYDGNGFSVEVNLSTTNLANGAGFGLFSETTGCTIKNLTVKGSITSTSSEKNQRIGAVVGYANGVVIIDNCINYATVSAPNSGASSEIAGIIGRCYKAGVKITNCKNYGSISNSTGYAVGIVAMAGNGGDGTVTGCANYGDVTGGFASGIGGLMYCSIKNSYNFGAITGIKEDSKVTGIINSLGAAVTVENCFNAGSISNGNLLCAIGTSSATKATNILTIKKCYSVNAEASLGVKPTGSSAAALNVIDSYNVYNDDVAKGNGVTVVSNDSLKTTDISDAFTLLSENESNENYNKNYEYPQLKDNLVDRDYNK